MLLCFTRKKEELGLFTEAEANEMIDSINALKSDDVMIHKINEKSGSEYWVSEKYFDFEVAIVEFQQKNGWLTFRRN